MLLLVIIVVTKLEYFILAEDFDNFISLSEVTNKQSVDNYKELLKDVNNAKQETKYRSISQNRGFSRNELVIYHAGRTIAVAEVNDKDKMVLCWLHFKKEGEEVQNTVVRKTRRRVDLIRKISIEQMVKLISDCQNVDQHQHHPFNKQKKESKNVLSYLREKLMYEGTKWCGFGHTAKNYFDIGSNKNLDRCCRAHDFCPFAQQKFTKKNPTPITKMICECDRAFYDCLLALKSKIADKVGNIFFNAGRVDCVELRHPLKCRAWKDPHSLKNCLAWEEDDNTEPEVVVTSLGKDYPYTVDNNFRSSLQIEDLNSI